VERFEERVVFSSRKQSLVVVIPRVHNTFSDHRPVVGKGSAASLRKQSNAFVTIMLFSRPLRPDNETVADRLGTKFVAIPKRFVKCFAHEHKFTLAHASGSHCQVETGRVRFDDH
jgi:hypothetical protein